MFVTHTSERTITVCVSACVPTYQSLLIACESCHLYFALVANKQVDFRENVSVHPLVLLIFPSPTSPTNLCSRSRPSRHPATADHRGLAHYLIGCRPRVSVYWGDYVRRQTASDRQQSFHTWGDVGLLTAEPPAKGVRSRSRKTLIWSRRTRFASTSCRKQNLFLYMCYKAFDDITEINSGGSGHPMITSASPSHLLVWLPWWWPTPQPPHQIIIFSLGSEARAGVQPTPPCSQTGLIKRFAADLVSPGSCSPPTESQLLSERCVFTAVLAVLLITEVFGDKQYLLSFQLLN